MICMVCKEFNSGTNQTIRIKDDKESIDISGHIKCTDEMYEKLKLVKDWKKLSVHKRLNAINFKLD